MVGTTFYLNPVSASIVLKYEGRVLRVYSFCAMELTDAVSGYKFPLIFFQ
jgi:hypothetical protein